jgi:hypothetical protein
MNDPREILVVLTFFDGTNVFAVVGNRILVSSHIKFIDTPKFGALSFLAATTLSHFITKLGIGVASPVISHPTFWLYLDI